MKGILAVIASLALLSQGQYVCPADTAEGAEFSIACGKYCPARPTVTATATATSAITVTTTSTHIIFKPTSCPPLPGSGATAVVKRDEVATPTFTLSSTGCPPLPGATYTLPCRFCSAFPTTTTTTTTAITTTTQTVVVNELENLYCIV